MKRSNTFKNGKLYIISTPIGNLEDITERALKTIKEVDYLFCEDTRVSLKLLSFYDVKRSVDSFHDYSDKAKEDYIITLLKDNKSVGIISDCGTPLINDPGYEVVRKAIDNDIEVIPIVGASASLASLIKSGLTPKPFMFYGFLNHNKSAKKEELTKLKDYPFTIIYYESPNRIYETLELMYKVFKERKVAVLRELTKMYEEGIYFSLSEYESFPTDIKGEMVICVSGKENTLEDIDIDVNKEIEDLIKTGLSLKEACKVISSKVSKKSSDLYNEYLRCKK